MFEKCYRRAVETDSDIVCFDLWYVWDDGRKEISKGGDFDVTSYKEDPSLIRINNSANNKFYRTEFMMTRSFIKGIAYEDLASVPVWLAEAEKVAYLNEGLYYYVQREGSISHDANEKVFDIYKSIAHLKESLSLDSDSAAWFYRQHCVVMTTLRIRDISDKAKRKAFYEKHWELLEENCPDWYECFVRDGMTFKQRVVYYLLKKRHFTLLTEIF